MRDELLKLHGIGFKGKILVMKKLETLTKAKIINAVNQNICPQTQPPQLDFDPENTVAPRSLQRINNSYRNAAIPKKGDTTLFPDSISRGMNIKEIDS